MLRFLTAGESHGRALVVIVEGLPAGLKVSADQISDELARRRLGFGRGPRMRLERDELTILSGVRHGRTLGSPLAVQVANSEWAKWEAQMSPEPVEAPKRLTRPRPGHADLAGMQKYGLDDARDVLERASARETAARVVAGVLAKALLSEIGVRVLSHVVAIGSTTSEARRPRPEDLEAIDSSPVRCLDAEAEAVMVAEIEERGRAGDSLGGVVEVVAFDLPVGLGSHVHWDRRLDGRLAGALMSIQAVKSVEIGDAASVVGLPGSEAHDSIVWDGRGYRRASDHAGGIEGGMSIGGDIHLRIGMKPLATLRRPALSTVDVDTKETAKAIVERTDVTAVPAMGVVAESMVALILADEALRKFGGDSVAEFRRNHGSFVTSLSETERPGDHVLLVGMMGAGKTTVGTALAKKLDRPYIDNDAQVEHVTGRTIPEIWEEHGEAEFRRQEAAAVQAATLSENPAVIAVAGGAVLDERNRQAIRSAGRIVWLRARVPTLAERVGDGEGRPLLSGPARPQEALERLAEERRPLYQELADVVVDVDGLEVGEIVDVITRALRSP